MSKEGVFKEAAICLPLSSSTNPSSIRNPPPYCGASATSNVAQKLRSSSTAASKRKLPVTTSASRGKRPACCDSAASETLFLRIYWILFELFNVILLPASCNHFILRKILFWHKTCVLCQLFIHVTNILALPIIFTLTNLFMQP